MKTVFIILIFFLAVGMFVRSYNRLTYTLLGAGIVGMLLFLYFA